MVDLDEIDAEEEKALEEKSERWSTLVLLGPIGPALYSLIVIFVGTLILKFQSLDCGYYLDLWLTAAVVFCMLFMIVFSWVFLGFKVTITLKDRQWTVLKPFPNLLVLGLFYGIIFLFSFIWWCIGTAFLGMGAATCPASAPVLYGFCSFLIIMYWLGFAVAVFALIRTNFSKQITAQFKEARRFVSPNLADPSFLTEKFMEYDEGGIGSIERQYLGPLLKDCGRNPTKDELEQAMEVMDPEQEGYIDLNKFLSWFKSGKIEDADSDDDEEEDSEEEDSEDGGYDGYEPKKKL